MPSCIYTVVFGGVPYPLLPHLCVQEVQGFQSTAQVEQLLLEHGERVVDRMGTEIDRVEIKIMLTWRLSDDGDYFNL